MEEKEREYYKEDFSCKNNEYLHYLDNLNNNDIFL